jgi:hypothetical protein
MASDGSLILSCPAERFSRPGAGVLRYSAQISQELGAALNKAALRTHVQSALADGTEVHPVLITTRKGETSRMVHMRPDLTGKIVEFDGDHFVVDFTRPAPPPEAPKVRRRG